jgi:3-oxoacyl-[acyl-carrier protein] reductase
LAYAASKSAVIGFSRTLTYEVKDFGIKVFNVSPGRCATAMRRALRPDEDETKIMQPEEVGNLIAIFVKNPDCSIDGQDIIVRKLD